MKNSMRHQKKAKKILIELSIKIIVVFIIYGAVMILILEYITRNNN